jgi:hypothetical protein
MSAANQTPEQIIASLGGVRQTETKAVQLVWTALIPLPLPLYQVNLWLDEFSFDAVVHGIRKAAKRHARGDSKTQAATYLTNYAEMQMRSRELRDERRVGIQ